MLQDWRQWSRLSVGEQSSYAAKAVPPAFEYRGATASGRQTPAQHIFVHVAHLPRLEFVLIPGGKVWIGLSPEELQTALRFVPAGTTEVLLTGDRWRLPGLVEVDLGPFLVARQPLLLTDCESYVDLDIGDGRPTVDGSPLSVAYLSQSELQAMIRTLTGLRLVTESEWEVACRGPGGADASSRHPFWFGDAPVTNELDSLLALDYDAGVSPRHMNGYGMSGLDAGEFCVTSPRLPRPSSDAVMVIRGGAACAWPWQSETELLLMLSAMRSPVDAFDGFAAVRLAASL